MVERVMAFDEDREGQRAMRLVIEIEPVRAALFRRWARHLGLTRGQLGDVIFQLGTVELALETCNSSAADMAEREVGTVADYMLDRMERMSQTWIEQKEEEDSGTHAGA